MANKAAKRERQRVNRQARQEYEAAVEKRRRFWRSARTFAIIAVPVLAVGIFITITRDSSDDSNASTSTPTPKAMELPAPTGISIDQTKTYTATIKTSEGTIEIALDAVNAPTSVNNFVYLAKAGFYDKLPVNRAVKDFVIQTGERPGDSPGYSVQSEGPPSAYEVGSVAWAKTATEAPGTAGSQFFIGTGSNITTLPSDYGYIGTVTEGLSVAKKIMGYAPSSGDGAPTKDVTVNKVTITES